MSASFTLGSPVYALSWLSDTSFLAAGGAAKGFGIPCRVSHLSAEKSSPSDPPPSPSNFSVTASLDLPANMICLTVSPKPLHLPTSLLPSAKASRKGRAPSVDPGDGDADHFDLLLIGHDKAVTLVAVLPSCVLPRVAMTPLPAAPSPSPRSKSAPIATDPSKEAVSLRPLGSAIVPGNAAEPERKIVAWSALSDAARSLSGGAIAAFGYVGTDSGALCPILVPTDMLDGSRALTTMDGAVAASVQNSPAQNARGDTAASTAVHNDPPGALRADSFVGFPLSPAHPSGKLTRIVSMVSRAVTTDGESRATREAVISVSEAGAVLVHVIQLAKAADASKLSVSVVASCLLRAEDLLGHPGLPPRSKPTGGAWRVRGVLPLRGTRQPSTDLMSKIGKTLEQSGGSGSSGAANALRKRKGVATGASTATPARGATSTVEPVIFSAAAILCRSGGPSVAVTLVIPISVLPSKTQAWIEIHSVTKVGSDAVTALGIAPSFPSPAVSSIGKESELGLLGFSEGDVAVLDLRTLDSTLCCYLSRLQCLCTSLSWQSS